MGWLLFCCNLVWLILGGPSTAREWAQRIERHAILPPSGECSRMAEWWCKHAERLEDIEPLCRHEEELWRAHHARAQRNERIWRAAEQAACVRSYCELRNFFWLRRELLHDLEVMAGSPVRLPVGRRAK